MKLRVMAIAAIAAVATASQAALTVYDFEEFPGSFSDTDTSITSLISVKDGITMTMYRSSGLGFCTFDLLSHAPAFRFPKSWGERAVSPFGSADASDYFICNFDQALSYVEVEMTDFAQDEDIMEIYAYTGLDGTGSLVNSDINDWGLRSAPKWAGMALYCDDTPIRSVVMRGGSRAFPNSMYIDNIGVCAAVPEPGTLAAIGAGVLGLLARRRKA